MRRQQGEGKWVPRPSQECGGRPCHLPTMPSPYTTTVQCQTWHCLDTKRIMTYLGMASLVCRDGSSACTSSRALGVGSRDARDMVRGGLQRTLARYQGTLPGYTKPFVEMWVDVCIQCTSQGGLAWRGVVCHGAPAALPSRLYFVYTCTPLVATIHRVLGHRGSNA